MNEAIQILATELESFKKQRDTLAANLNATDGAIQATQHLITKLSTFASSSPSQIDNAPISDLIQK